MWFLTEKKKEENIKEMAGRIKIEDIDRDEDLIWAVGDLVNLEKHLATAIYNIEEKIKKEPKNENLKSLLNFASRILNEVREHRTIHLERLYYIKEYGLWCSVKHIIGAMYQFTEVASKDMRMALQSNEGTDGENFKNAIKDYRTSKFLHDLLILMKKFSEKNKF